MSNFVVGLTGGIGSGKTAVSNCFQDLGIQVVDADVIAREVVAPGSEGLNSIKQRFGKDIITAEGQLDRAKLRQIIFDDPAEKQWLNQLLHPKIREQMIMQCQQANSDYVILSVPLLVENNLQPLANRILVVDVPEDLQVHRTVQRDKVSEQQVRNILAAQCDRQSRIAAADDIISNDKSLSELKQQVLKLHQHYLTLASG